MTGITFTSGADHDVYFMQPTDGGPIKIGISCDVRAAHHLLVHGVGPAPDIVKSAA